ncbi:hypothetical protein OSCI_3460090 [Kamptonema sp. PCC 6506]|uniref:hypothetical protein n=1 Tax=Kamptonema formosum TaxID=331992 RepID=UPI0001DACCAE|nr:hypothetical protein [Kamptonema formosum]CBN57568.1 hypothetical protein OSCI_3460090 [Kamptonema sp. PCC 6506]
MTKEGSFYVRQITYDVSLRKAEAASEAWREAKQSQHPAIASGKIRTLATARSTANNDQYLTGHGINPVLSNIT